MTVASMKPPISGQFCIVAVATLKFADQICEVPTRVSGIDRNGFGLPASAIRAVTDAGE
ncbi:MAG: hypothetical protein BWY66_00283 [bacterium ADurb.Bin374]|nr:MAG: hypothetical protein BWY66_00283 [bacterium ADurb.Bin374]